MIKLQILSRSNIFFQKNVMGTKIKEKVKRVVYSPISCTDIKLSIQINHTTIPRTNVTKFLLPDAFCHNILLKRILLLEGH